MANYLDFLEALDRRTRSDPSGDISPASAMHQIARDAGLSAAGSTEAARWAGQLVDGGYLEASGLHPGAQSPPSRAPWSDTDLQRFSSFTVTAAGRSEAEGTRQHRRGLATDALLGSHIDLDELSLDSQRGLERPATELRRALDGARHAAAAAAAKDLVEVACKVCLARAGIEAPKRARHPELFKTCPSTPRPRRCRHRPKPRSRS